MSSNDAIGHLFEMAKSMTILKFVVPGRPVFCDVLVYWVCNLQPSVCDKVPNPLTSAVTALLMTYLVMEYAGLHFKIYGIIWFSRFVWFVMYWTSIMTLVQAAINPLKG